MNLGLINPNDPHAVRRAFQTLQRGLGFGSSPKFADLTLTSPSSIYSLNHDSFAGFVSDEHVAHSGVSISAGTGMSGGGDISASRTLSCTITQYTDALARAAISETVTGLDYNNTTGVLSLTSGYVIPTTTEETNWNAAYNHIHNLTTDIDHNQLTNTHQDVTTGASPTFANLTVATNVGEQFFSGIASANATYKNVFYNNGITDFTRLLLFNQVTAAVNSVASPLTFKHTSTGDMVDGFGPGLLWAIQDNAGVENFIARIVAIRDGHDKSGKLQLQVYWQGTELISALNILSNGNVGIGTVSPKTRLTIEGTATLKEQAAADADNAAYGQLWVKSDTPNTLWFTDDTGVDIKLSHNLTTDIDHDSLTNFSADEHFTQAGITVVGTIATGIWSGTEVAITKGGTGQVTAQTAIDALTQVAGATNEHVLTKDTVTGNAIWKVATGGADAFTVKIDAEAAAGYIGAAANDGVLRAGSGLSYVDGGDFITLDTVEIDPATAALVYLSANQTITKDSITQIQLNTEIADLGSCFNTGTYTWTCPATGYYLLCGGATLVDVASGKIVYYFVRVNGGNEAILTVNTTVTNQAVGFNFAKLFKLTLNDTVTFHIYHNDTVNRLLAAGNDDTWATIHRVTK